MVTAIHFPKKKRILLAMVKRASINRYLSLKQKIDFSSSSLAGRSIKLCCYKPPIVHGVKRPLTWIIDETTDCCKLKIKRSTPPSGTGGIAWAQWALMGHCPFLSPTDTHSLELSTETE